MRWCATKLQSVYVDRSCCPFGGAVSADCRGGGVRQECAGGVKVASNRPMVEARSAS